MTQQPLRLGSLTVDLGRLRLEGGSSDAMALRPKSFDVLRYLAENAGRVVTKEELIAAVWSGVTVSDESLTQCISEVRRAVGDLDKQIIKTIPRRGYLVEVSPPADGEGRDSALEVPLIGSSSTFPRPVQASGEHNGVANTAHTAAREGRIPQVEMISRALGAIVTCLAKPVALLVMGIALVAGTIGTVTSWSTNKLDGAWRGAILCEKLPFTDLPLIAAMAVNISGSSAAYSRDVYSPDHLKIIGAEEGTGTVAADGAIRLTGGWSLGPTMLYAASYAGKLADHAADLRGTQSWKLDGQDFTRNCTIRLSR